MSNTELPDDELRQEQQFVDGLYARVDALRGDAEVSVTEALAQGHTPRQARLERDILVAERSGLLAAQGVDACVQAVDEFLLASQFTVLEFGV